MIRAVKQLSSDMLVVGTVVLAGAGLAAAIYFAEASKRHYDSFQQARRVEDETRDETGNCRGEEQR